MMLNRVDLPQPDGPITARNSPGATSDEMWSTAVMMPSGVSKRFTMSLTTSIGAASCDRDARSEIGVTEAIKRAQYPVCSLPPCGGGLGRGVGQSRSSGKASAEYWDPHP